MTHLKIGDVAPNINAKNQNGELVELSKFKGTKIILYFYPRNNTPGCTAEACNLNDNFDALEKANCKIIGVSPDKEKSHLKFIAKHSLNFDLISDEDKSVMKNYGVWGEKKIFGITKEGVFRTTFVIDENGLIEKIFTKVQTKNHSQQILNEL